jgi:hypothetical protein
MRVPKAEEAIERVGNLSNKNRYDYSEDEARKIEQRLHEAVDRMFQRRFKL